MFRKDYRVLEGLCLLDRNVPARNLRKLRGFRNVARSDARYNRPIAYDRPASPGFP